ncbi:hypothetical protein D9M69_586250 [compost metagenome]
MIELSNPSNINEHVIGGIGVAHHFVITACSPSTEDQQSNSQQRQKAPHPDGQLERMNTQWQYRYEQQEKVKATHIPQRIFQIAMDENYPQSKCTKKPTSVLLGASPKAYPYRQNEPNRQNGPDTKFNQKIEKDVVRVPPVGISPAWNPLFQLHQKTMGWIPPPTNPKGEILRQYQ